MLKQRGAKPAFVTKHRSQPLAAALVLAVRLIRPSDPRPHLLRRDRRIDFQRPRGEASRQIGERGSLLLLGFRGSWPARRSR